MKLKKMIVAGTLGVSALAASGYAFAMYYWTDVEYYSDASYTSVVGERIKDCSGRTVGWGVVTPYKVVLEQYPCSSPG